MSDIAEIDWDKESAEQFTNGLKGLLDRLIPKYASFVENEAWKYLDYDSFAEWWQKENMSEIRISAPERRIAIEQLREETPNISNREIAKTIGTSEITVRRDTPDSATYVAPKKGITLKSRKEIEKRIVKLSDEIEALRGQLWSGDHA